MIEEKVGILHKLAVSCKYTEYALGGKKGNRTPVPTSQLIRFKEIILEIEIKV